MPPVAIQNGSVFVFTFKEGVLSRVAHDLRLSAQRFQIEFEDGQVKARFPADKFQVDGVMQRGRLRRHLLSTKDNRDILDNMARDVLFSRRHREIRFQGRYEAQPDIIQITGELHLVGRRRAISFSLQRNEGRLAGEVTLTPSQWGIRPFSALMGTMRVQDRVVITFDLPDPGQG